jgi:signal transduction histidine kinase
MRVIVVDDEEGMRQGMRRVLERRGFDVDTAHNGGSAIELLEQKNYDIALVDLKMPGIDGFQVAEFINERQDRRTIVVIVSALATVEAAVEVTQRGAFAFLVKPFAPTDLLQVVERAVAQRRLINERETYLSELSQERSLSRQLINSMSDGVVVININEKPVLMNPRAEFVLGVRYSDELQIDDLGLSGPVRDSVESLLESSGTEGHYREFQIERGDLVLQVRTGSYIRGGEPAGVLILIRDISQEWKAEQDKNRFVSMVAHELNGPLAAIINYINIVISGMFDDQPEKIHAMLERSKIRGEALLALIQDLQYLNKREAGRIEKDVEPLALGDVLRDQIDFLKVQADRRGVEIVLVMDGEDFTLNADRGDMDRIFMNLISNGIKYNREGGKLTVTLRRDSGSLVVSFTDTGIGMSEKEMADLFQEFYRVKNARTQGIAGTGLGLATVKRVLAAYRGRIDVASTPEVGTTFTVTLPA